MKRAALHVYYFIFQLHYSENSAIFTKKCNQYSKKCNPPHNNNPNFAHLLDAKHLDNNKINNNTSNTNQSTS